MPRHAPELQHLIDCVLQARRDQQVLDIEGGRTKAFYGGERKGKPLSTTGWQGIEAYEPSELVVTVRAGTLLSELESTLAEKGQYLAFEPPRYGDEGTVGGMVASGLSGPARASAGSVRDHVLGASLLNGKGEVLNFGGQVIKNVAGYDMARLLAGSMGVLGVILSVSLKVSALPRATATLRFEWPQDKAITQINRWLGLPLPINASAWWDGTLVVRLSGAAAAVEAAAHKMGGEVVEPEAAITFWRGLRDHGDEFFVGARRALDVGAALWRLSVPATVPPLRLSGEQLIEWHGAQRWLATTTPAQAVREAVQQAGGHATLFAANDKSMGAFAPLPRAEAAIQFEIQKQFDPDGVFNPGRLK